LDIWSKAKPDFRPNAQNNIIPTNHPIEMASTQIGETVVALAQIPTGRRELKRLDCFGFESRTPTGRRFRFFSFPIIDFGLCSINTCFIVAFDSNSFSIPPIVLTERQEMRFSVSAQIVP
jgi:hypothetical protein